MNSFGKGGGLSINTDRNLLNPSSSTSQTQPPAAPGLTPAQGSATAGAGAGGGLFGSLSTSTAVATTSQPQSQTTGLFGTPLTAQPPQQQQQQQQQTGGLFGAVQSNNTGGTSGNNMFGNSINPATTTAGGGGGLFGLIGGGGSGLNNNNNTASQAQSAPSLFGNTINTQGGMQQDSKPAGTGLFGGLGSQSNNASAPSLFGAQAPKPSLFGSGANAQASGQQPSLFGLSGMAQNASQPAQQPGIGGSLLAQRNNPQQSIIAGVKIDVSNMRGTTRFNDLHEELQRKIEQADTFIQQQINYAGQCSALLPKHEQDLSYIPNDVEYVTHKLDTTELTIGNDSVAIAKLKDLVKEDTEDVQLSFKAIDNLKLPQHFHYSGLRLTGLAHSTRSAVDSATMDPSDDVPTSADFISYFRKRADAFARTVAEYDRNVHEIEIHLRTVEASAIAQTEMIMARSAISSNSASSSTRNGGTAAGGRRGSADAGARDDELRNLAAVLADFERGILSVASKVGAVKENVVELVVGSEDAFGNVVAPAHASALAPYGYNNNSNRRKGTAVR